MTNLYVNSHTKITRKKTSGKIDEVEKFVQSDVWKMNVTDNVRFSRCLFLERLNNRSSCSLSFCRLTRFFAQNIGILNLIQSRFIVCAFYRRFLIGSLRMSEIRGTLEGFGFKKARPIDDGRL